MFTNVPYLKRLRLIRNKNVNVSIFFFYMLFKDGAINLPVVCVLILRNEVKFDIATQTFLSKCVENRVCIYGV